MLGLSGSSLTTCTLGSVGARGRSVCTLPWQFGPQSAPSQPCHVGSVVLPLSSPNSMSSLLGQVTLTTGKKKKAWVSASEALTLSVSWLSPRSQWRFIFSADVPSVWQRVASPSNLKGLPLPRAQEAGKGRSVKATMWSCWCMIKRPNYQMIAFWI